jgi:hypothetical protein
MVKYLNFDASSSSFALRYLFNVNRKLGHNVTHALFVIVGIFLHKMLNFENCWFGEIFLTFLQRT